MLLNYFKSLYHANVAETFIDLSERSVYTFRGALQSTYIFRPMYFSHLITAWQLEVQGQLLPLHADTRLGCLSNSCFNTLLLCPVNV